MDDISLCQTVPILSKFNTRFAVRLFLQVLIIVFIVMLKTYFSKLSDCRKQYKNVSSIDIYFFFINVIFYFYRNFKLLMVVSCLHLWRLQFSLGIFEDYSGMKMVDFYKYSILETLSCIFVMIIFTNKFFLINLLCYDFS